MVVGSIASQFIAILFLPVISRLYSPEQFGVYSVYAGLIGVLSVVPTMRFEMAVFRANTTYEQASIIKFSFLIVVSISGFFGLLLLLATKFTSLENAHSLLSTSNSLLVFLSLIAAGFVTVLVALCTKAGLFKILAFAPVYGQISYITIALILFYLFGDDGYNLIIAFINSQFVLVLVYTLEAYRRNHFPRKVKLNPLKMFSQYKDYARYTLPGSIFGAIANHSPIILLGAYFGPITAGCYGITMKVIQLPMYLFGNPLGRAFNSHFSDAESQVERARLFEQNVEILISVIIFPCALLTLYSVEAFTFVFGSNWELSGKFAAFLSPYLLFWFVAAPISVVNVLMNLQLRDTVFQSVNLTLKISTVTFAFVFFDSEMAIILLSLAGSMFFLTYIFDIGRTLGVNWKNIFKPLSGRLLYCALSLLSLNLLDGIFSFDILPFGLVMSPAIALPYYILLYGHFKSEP